MKGTVKKIVLSTILASLIVGCGSTSSSSSTTSASGGAQKGPFKSGQKVTATKLKADGSVDTSVDEVITKTDDLGKFSFSSLAWSGATKFKVEGEYFNESTGEYTPGGLLTAITDVEAGTAPKVNINILTHIAASNIKAQMAQNIPIATAKAKAKETVAKVFNIDLSNTKLEELDITNENDATASDEEKAANTQLLKISAALSATEDPEETLDSLAKDLIDNEVDDEAEDTFKELKEKESEVKLEEVAAKMKAVIKVDTIPQNDDFLNGTMSLNNNIDFSEELEASTGSIYESNTISVSGINGTKAADISIEGGEFSINGNEFTSAATTINNNDTLTIRVTSSNDYDTLSTAIVTIGGVDFDFDIVTESNPFVSDTKIKAFEFVSLTKKALDTSVTSAAVTIDGINTETAISVNEGTTYEISTNGGIDWSSPTSTAGTINNGDQLRVTHTTSSDYKARTKSTVTFGSGTSKVIADFKSYTLAQDKTPDTFTIATKYDTAVYDEETTSTQYVEFEPITVSGIDGSVRVRVNAGEVKVGSGEWRDTDYTLDSQTPLLVTNGQEVTVRHKASSDNNTKTISSVGIGTKVAEFISYTELESGVDDTYVNEFLFTPQFNVEIDDVVISNEIIVDGIDKEVSISIENGEYSKNGGAYTSLAGIVNVNDTISVRHTTSSESLESTETTLKIGEYETEFLSYTKAPADTIPNSFGFKRSYAVETNIDVESNAVYVRGINASANVSIENGEFSISIDNGNTWGDWLSTGTIEDNQMIKVRHVSDTKNAEETVSTLKIGNDSQYEAKFTSITKTSAPEVNGTPLSSVVNGQMYTFTPVSTTAEEWEIENKPEWAYFNKTTGVLSGTPNKVEFEKTYSGIQITAKNDGGDTSLTVFDIDVTGVTPAITIGTVSSQYSIFNDISIQVDVIDTLNDTHTFSLNNAPSFLSIDSNGKITGSKDDLSASDKGEYKFTVTVEDSKNNTVTSSEITLNIIETSSVATDPVITGTPLLKMLEDDHYDVSFQVSDINGDTLTVSMTGNPDWLNISQEGNTVHITGIAPQDFNGDLSAITVSVNDGTGRSTSLDPFVISVTPVNDAPVVSNVGTSINTSRDSILSGILSVSDVDANESHTFAKVTDPLSGTVTVNSSGSFEYTPNSDFIGTDTFTFKANDGEADSNIATVTINVTDGSITLDTDVDAAIKKIESIDPEVENINTKLAEAKELLDGNTTSEGKILSLAIALAEITNDSDVASLLNFSNTSLDSTSTLNKVVRSMVSDVISLDVIDNPVDLSLTATIKLNKIADELKKISDEFGSLFTSSEDVYTYDGENMDYNDSLVLRASILSISAQLKQLSSYQWGSNADIEIRDYEGNEYRNINVDPASVFNAETVYKLTSDASSRLPEAKAFLSQAADLLLELPLGYDGDIEDEETGLIQEDKEEITSIKLSLAGTTAYTLEIDDDEDIKEVKVDLSKMYDVSTALDITSFGTNWQNLCYEGDIISIEDAKKEGTLDCKVVDWYDSYSDVTYAHFESAEAEPQTMPTSANSKIDDIVLSITKIDDTVLSGQDMIDFMLSDETKVEALDTIWENSKYSSDYLVNGNDVKVDEQFDTLKINAYKADGTDSKAQAKKNFSTPKSEIKAKIRLKDIDEVNSITARGSFQAVINNINSSDEKINAYVQLRNNQVQYYIGRYDSTGSIEIEDYTDYTNDNHKFSETSTVNDDGSFKFAVSIATSGADIILNVSKVDALGTVIDTYDEKIITTDSSFDLGIDEARFRSEIRLSDDDGTLYDQITAPTKLRVHSFSTVDSYPDAPLATLSVGDTAILTGTNPWYDIMTVNNGSLTLEMYDYDSSSGLYSTPETENILINLTDGSSSFTLTEEGKTAEIMNTVQVGDNLFKSDINFTNTAETTESDTWDWDDHGATNIDELITVFTNGSTYFQTANTTFMLKPNGIITKGTFTHRDEYGDHFTYGDEILTENTGWVKSGNQISVNLSDDYKVLMTFELNSSNQIVNGETFQVGYSDSDYLYTGSGALQYFENQTGINPND